MSAHATVDHRLEPSGIVCAGHFLEWLEAHGLRLIECGPRHVGAYEASLSVGSRFAYARTARELVELVAPQADR